MIEKSKLPTFDPAHDVLHYEKQVLDAIFSPNNVAVIGAKEGLGSVGRTIVWNLISSPFGGAVFPVNPKRPSVLGIKAYPSVAALLRTGGPGCDCYSGTNRPWNYFRMCGCGCKRRYRHLSRV